MPLPAPLVGLAVRARVITANATPVVGATVTLTPIVPARSPSGDVLLAPIALSEVTGVDGTVEWTDVLATDSPGLSNRVPYKVTITGSAGHLLEHPYPVELLSSMAVGGVLRLDDVAPALTAPATTSYVLAASVGAVGGPAGPLDASGKVPAAQLPTAGGSIPSTIVDAPGDIVAASAPDTPARHPVGSNGQVLTVDSTQTTGLRWKTLATSDITSLDTTLAGKVNKAILAAKGDLYVATAADTPGRLAVGADGQTLVADSSQSAGVRWSARTTPAYDPAMDGLIAVAADPVAFHIPATLGAGWAVRMRVPAGAAITGALACVHQTGTLGAGGVNGYAVNDDSGALIASTVDDHNLWTVTGPRPKAFPSGIAAQNTDRYVYVSVRVNGYDVAPYFVFAEGSSAGARLDGLNQAKRRAPTLSGSTWGAFDPTTGSSLGYMPFIAIY